MKAIKVFEAYATRPWAVILSAVALSFLISACLRGGMAPVLATFCTMSIIETEEIVAAYLLKKQINIGVLALSFIFSLLSGTLATVL